MQYAIEIDALPANPLKAVKWTRPRTLKTVDPRTVVNSDQARRLLAAVGRQGPRGERMVAFFGCMYYAALRPEEAAELRRRQSHQPARARMGRNAARLTPSHAAARTGPTTAAPASAANSSTGPPGETRPVPVHPELVALLRSHLKQHGAGPNGRVFTGARRGALTDRAYLAVFHKARDTAFSAREAASLLARRPYDLRHAAVSTWLNAGVAPPQVAEWAGHSVDVLLRVYAKCISGSRTRPSGASSKRPDQTTAPPRTGRTIQ